MVSTLELIDRFQCLLELECSTAYHLTDYLAPPSGSHDNESKGKKRWRTQVIGWMYQVVDHHLLDRELVYVAMSYLDRYLSKLSWSEASEGAQLVGATSLYMAIKILHRNEGKCATVASFAALSKDLFTADDMLGMEKSILDALEWRMHPPTPLSYLQLLITLLPHGASRPLTRRALFERIKFLVEVSATVPFFFAKRPSNVAVAAFLAVLEHGTDESNGKRQPYISHFRHCLRSFAGIYCDSGEAVECVEAMRVVHENALGQMNDEVMNERESAGCSPVATKRRLRVVTP